MSNVYFEPWVGCQYSEGINGKRVMVLGHVHVCESQGFHQADAPGDYCVREGIGNAKENDRSPQKSWASGRFRS